MASTIDALDTLIKAGCSEAQARATVRVMEAVIADHRDELATKADLLAVKSELEKGQQALRTDMQTLRADIYSLILKCTFGLAAFMAALKFIG